MSNSEIDALEPGRKLDMLVAEQVMGWLVDPIFRIYAGADREMLHCNEPPIGSKKKRWSPSTSIAAAWEVVEKLQLSIIPNNIGTKWEAGIWHDDDIDSYHHGFYTSDSAFCDTAPHAICLAALKAIAAQ